MRFFLLLLVALVAGADASIGQDGGGGDDDVLEVFSVVKGSVALPCNLTAPRLTDGPRLVLWYKDGSPQPIFSVDSRFSTTKHWSEIEEFGRRASFRYT